MRIFIIRSIQIQEKKYKNNEIKIIFLNNKWKKVD